MTSGSDQTNRGFLGAVTKFRESRLLTLAAAFVLGLATHWAISGSGGSPDGPSGPDVSHDHDAGTTSQWTCSMHPQIIKPNSGKCPICGMDLIPLQSGGVTTNLREISISPAAKALMNVRTSPVERRYVDAEIRMVGKVDYDETRRKFITAWIPGRLDRLYVDYTGVRVRQGDHMAYVYSPDLYAAQQELIEAIRSARNRPESPLLRDTGIDLVESAREKLRLLGMKKEQIREIEQREKPSDHMTVYAPMGGVVVEKLKQEGDYVKTGDRIYGVADLTQVWVKLDAYESDLPWLRYGQEVTFTTEAYPGDRFVGRIAFIDPVLNEKTRTVKVRVNVPNPEGKLKPEMFVRGLAVARIAGAGRVIDEDLAGKWISPMHPEIVKDEPGMCDICGMPLVRAETLGYVSDQSLDDRRPLVIPASAVLLTGKRAVVYVQVPDREQPTYVGREVLLGPRAGDFYQVRAGLSEGERVVTHGNFKIDSALQIQAKPSMMTPQGGGGGGHDHGHGSEKKTREHGDHAPAQPSTIPPEFQAQLEKMDAAFQSVQRALEAKNLSRVRAAFRLFEQAVNRVDVELVSGHPAMLWKEFDMLLTNDVVAGSDVEQLEEARKMADNAGATMQRVRKQLISGSAAEAADQLRHLETPESFRKSIADIWDAYVQLQTALARDDTSSARSAIDELARTVSTVDNGSLSPRAAELWTKERTNLRKILDALGSDEDLKGLRASFALLTGEIEVLVHAFGVGEAGPVYRANCPMAFGNRGGEWLQRQEEVLNPYFGSTMLKCHDRFQKIASGSPPEKNAAEDTEPREDASGDE